MPSWSSSPSGTLATPIEVRFASCGRNRTASVNTTSPSGSRTVIVGAYPLPSRYTSVPCTRSGWFTLTRPGSEAPPCACTETFAVQSSGCAVRSRVAALRLHRGVRGEVDRLSDRLLVPRLVHRVELLEREPVGVEGRVVEEAARVERVVGRERVHERLALHHDPLAREPETAADADRHEHAEQRRVEHEVAGLPQVAALRRHGCLAAHVVALDPVARTLELGRGPADRAIRRLALWHGALGVPRKPREPRGRTRRACAQR